MYSPSQSVIFLRLLISRTKNFFKNLSSLLLTDFLCTRRKVRTGDAILLRSCNAITWIQKAIPLMNNDHTRSRNLANWEFLAKFSHELETLCKINYFPNLFRFWTRLYLINWKKNKTLLWAKEHLGSLPRKRNYSYCKIVPCTKCIFASLPA